MERIHFHYPTAEEQLIVIKYNQKQLNNHSYRHFSIPDLKIGYITQGNFTICLIKYKHCRYIGVTKRNPNADENNIQRAKDISLYRAMNNPVYLNTLDEQ